MSARRMGRFPVESPEWLDARLGGIGGSDVASCLDLSPWVSRFSLWHQKARTIDFEPMKSEPIYWGKALEKVVLNRWREGHPEHGTAHYQGYTWCDEALIWRHANPDFIATSPTRVAHEIVEIKTSAFADDWGKSGTQEVPPYYLTQLLWYLDIFGLNTGWLAVLIGGNDYREYRIDKRDYREDLALIREKTAEFWDSVQAGKVPPIDSSDSTYQTIREMHPDIEDEAVEIDPLIAVELLAAKEQKDYSDDCYKGCLSRLADAIGDAKAGTVGGYKIASRRAQKRGDEWGTPFVVLDRKAAENYDRYVNDLDDEANKYLEGTK